MNGLVKSTQTENCSNSSNFWGAASRPDACHIHFLEAMYFLEALLQQQVCANSEEYSKKKCKKTPKPILCNIWAQENNYNRGKQAKDVHKITEHIAYPKLIHQLTLMVLRILWKKPCVFRLLKITSRVFSRQRIKIIRADISMTIFYFKHMASWVIFVLIIVRKIVFPGSLN